MFKFNSQCVADNSQRPIDGIKEAVNTCIVLWPDPFGFHFPQQGSDEGNTTENKRRKVSVASTIVSIR